MTESRNYRLDVVRGLALLIIYVDHVTNCWLHYLTPQGWQVCDFAEVFVFISGFSTSLAYARYPREAIAAVAARSVRRAWKLYYWYLLSLAATLGTIYVAMLSGLPLLGSALQSFQRTPLRYIAGAFYFHNVPNMFSVLALYIVLLLALPTIWWCGRRSLYVLILASAALYICSYFYTRGGHSLDSAEWGFKPMAWQLMFVAGYVWPKIRWPQWIRSRLVFGVGCGIVIVCGILTLASLYGPAFHLRGAAKDSLGMLRIVNFAGWTLLLRPWWRRLPKITWLMACGRHSLSVFCAGAWLSVVSAHLIAGLHADKVVQFGIVLCGTALLALQAYLLDRARSRARVPVLAATAPIAPASAKTLPLPASYRVRSPGLHHADLVQTGSGSPPRLPSVASRDT